MTATETVIRLGYLLAAVAFVLGLHLMNSPATARRGNLVSAGGMALAVVLTVWHLATDRPGATGPLVLAAGVLVGGVAGALLARRVAMTAMPQLVSLFNAVGGGAAALVAVAEYARLAGGPVGVRTTLTTVLDVVIGATTFTGSLVAAGKLQGWVTGSPVLFPGRRAVGLTLVAVVLAGAVWLFVAPSVAVLVVVIVAAAAFGVVMVLPIGGADMPVVISLLNAFTGTAVAMAGFVLDSTALIIAGALVGASGTILTKLMADAMNRSVVSVLVGGFGTGDGPAAAVAATAVRRTTVDDAAIQLAYARKVIVVPGYGLAAAQAQHELSALADLLGGRGVDVRYAIHPVAGRMPGHMNVLLAEANVPYPMLREMDEINPEFPLADVALVVGANDVTNPAARRPGNPVSGMPILDVDKARSVIVIKRSMGHGYAGIDNELYAGERTSMLFADAKSALADLSAAVKTLVG
ncbi:NAD(P)(+) transhydrogenase (Re/Si-specific) subunit beta [Actinocatenispora rupis]|uniref:NAD(P) transhydrogenase subunit beta n=1 Tax=Actinocatenispora rupis TaxID=519421 RepID=A0A8J3NCS3_9ACTN|nr:NAD(P)(+) transhydrogenase (Re/Si-specific) subunit beta [Actinocatenispora rupis]GID12097.1 NAD(P) transhydrogenase subunit beta [Actinocatenispora rupis]